MPLRPGVVRSRTKSGNPTLTIDSNVVLDCLEREVQAACDLIALHPGRVTVQVANRTPDQEATVWAGRLDALDIARKEVFFRFDISRLDGPDVLAGDEDTARLAELQSVLFPNGITRSNGEADFAKVADIDILDAHLRSGANYFVTRDEHFLKAREQLGRQFGTIVLTPEESLQELGMGSTAGKLPVAKAARDVVVHEPAGLHQRITDRRPDEAETAAAELLRHRL